MSTSGSDASGTASPPRTGGNAGNLVLDAVTGTLSLDGNVSADGGSGAAATSGYALGGTGGSGGQVIVLAHAIGALASLSSTGGDGGDYGATQGAGGAGGAILAFTDAPIFDGLKLVDSDGGNGNPTGAQGHQSQDMEPTGLAIRPTTGVLSFTSQSPDAQSYRILMSVGGAAPVTDLQTAATSGLTPHAPLCQPVSFTVVAVNSSVGWTSAPSGAVAYTRRPSATQGCSDPPRVSAADATQRRTVRQLRRAHWLAAITVQSSGIGALQETLSTIVTRRSKGKTTSTRRTLLTDSTQITRAGRQILRLHLPAGARSAGTYRLRLTTTSPDGTRRTSTTLTLEIVS